MSKITITEALAEIKTAEKKIAKKQDFVLNYLSRMDGLKDPLEKDGGSPKLIEQERQAIADLEARIVELRRGIQKANEDNEITINKTTRSIADWLVWRREVAPRQSSFLRALNQRLALIRDEARRKGSSIVLSQGTAEKPTDIIVNINESNLAKDTESLEEILSTIDGQLSLKNATVMVG